MFRVIEIKDNKVNLCDSCRKTYPECDCRNVLFGDGIGQDNICCCDAYIADKEKSKKESEEEKMESITIRNNKVNLCDSCRKTYPECDCRNVLFGDGKGEDNICCCNAYMPKRLEGEDAD